MLALVHITLNIGVVYDVVWGLACVTKGSTKYPSFQMVNMENSYPHTVPSPISSRAHRVLWLEHIRLPKAFLPSPYPFFQSYCRARTMGTLVQG